MKLNKLRYHVLAWLIYIIYELGLLRFYGPILHPKQLIAFYLLEISLFYLHFSIYRKIAAKPSGHYKKWLYPFVSLALLSLFVFIKWYLAIAFDHINGAKHDAETMRKYLAGTVFRSALTIGESIGYWILYRGWKKEKAMHRMRLDAEREKTLKLELQQELIMAHNAWLQSRINPHLLYNTLNFFYSKLGNEPALKEGIELLVKIVRFSMGRPGTDGMVSIGEEWDQVENYIRLQQIRFDRRQFISYIFINNNPETRLPPVILLTLVENVYKHGSLEDQRYPASLKLITRANGWSFTINNIKRNASHQIPGEHLGMQNVSTRLRQAYGTQHFSMVTNDISDKHFTLELKVFTNP